LQVSGAAAEFERALIHGRQGRAGKRAHRWEGLRARSPAALRKVRLTREDGIMKHLNETAKDRVAHVCRLRPDLAW
jgi:hypothetical protein